MTIDFKTYYLERLDRIEGFLQTLLDLPASAPPRIARLYSALRYTVLKGGKRLRPLLVYAVAESLGQPLIQCDAMAAAVELIHCYSLIHDDLPAMDNDVLRRGKASCHKAFNEATAILAGDALQCLAFEILSDPRRNPVTPTQQVAMIHCLATSSGPQGMIQGQILDMYYSENSNQRKKLSFKTLCEIPLKKTAALIEAAALGGLLVSPDYAQYNHRPIKKYGRYLGLCFQLQNDILDRIGNTKTLGKATQTDQNQQKATFVNQQGLQATQTLLAQWRCKTLDAIACFGPEADRLRELLTFFIQDFHK